MHLFVFILIYESSSGFGSSLGSSFTYIVLATYYLLKFRFRIPIMVMK